MCQLEPESDTQIISFESKVWRELQMYSFFYVRILKYQAEVGAV